MPFDFANYQKKCDGLSIEELQKEWENYTRQISGAATSTAASVLFSPLTAGVSLVGLGLSAPRIHNARKKREIIEAGLQARGTTHHTRPVDVIAPIAITGTISGLTLGLVAPGVDVAAGAIVQRGVEYAATQGALEATGSAIESGLHARNKKASVDGTQHPGSPEQIPLAGSGFESPALGLQISNTWPQEPEDGQRPGPQATPSIYSDYSEMTVSTSTSSSHYLYDEINLQIQQDLSGWASDAPSPQPGIQSSHTWPQNSGVSTPTDAEIMALGADRAKLARAQNKLDMKMAKNRKPVNSVIQPPITPQESQSMNLSPESMPAHNLSRGLSVRSIIVTNPDNGKPTAMTTEEEVLFLRGRLLQLEKRGQVPKFNCGPPTQGQQTLRVQVLVEDEHEDEVVSGHFHESPNVTAPFQWWSQAPDEKTHSLSPSSIPPEDPIQSQRSQITRVSLSINQEPRNTSSAQAQAKPMSIPRKKVGAPAVQSVHTTNNEASQAHTHEQNIPRVPIALNDHPNHQSSPEPTKQPHENQRQDSGYYSIASTPAIVSPASSSFGLAPEDEFPFMPQSFGLPPIFYPKAMGYLDTDARSTLPSIKKAAIHDQRSSSKSKLSLTRSSPHITEQEYDEPQPRLPQQVVDDQVLTSLPPTPQAAGYRTSQSSIEFIPPPPPPYCSPPIIEDLPVEKDYFGRNAEVAVVAPNTFTSRARYSILGPLGIGTKDKSNEYVETPSSVTSTLKSRARESMLGI